MSNLSQFYGGIKSIQRFTVLTGPTPPSGIFDQTITAVDVDKTILNYLGEWQGTATGISLLNSTTVRIQNGGSQISRVSFEVIEYF